MGSEVGRKEEVKQAPSTPTSGPVQGGSAKPEELLAEVLSNHLLWPSIGFRVGKKPVQGNVEGCRSHSLLGLNQDYKAR